jgi:hypothetical protein
MNAARRKRLSPSIVAGLFIFSPPAHTISAAPPLHQTTKQPLAETVAIVGEPDRRTEEEWATEHKMTLTDVQDRYAATGILSCKKLELSADLAMVDDVIVTSAHVFRDMKTCKKIEDPKDCKFTIKVGDQKQTSGLAAIIAQGFVNCPKKPSDDWAIVRLSKKVKGVSPYVVDPIQEIDINQEVTSVTALNIDLYRDKVRLPMHTKTMGRCLSAFIYRVAGEAGLFSSECDGGEGQSGGAILNDDFKGPPVLLGIHRGVSETEMELHQALTRGEANKRDFDEDHWANRHVALRGTFLKTLLDAVGR